MSMSEQAQVYSHPLATRHSPLATRISLDRLVMAGTVLILLVLAVYPSLYLVWGSVSSEGAFTLDNFRRAFSSPLYYNALLNTVYLGAGVAALSVLWGLPIAWAVSRTNMPAKGLIRALVGVSYVAP